MTAIDLLAESASASDSLTEGIVEAVGGAIVLVVPGYVLGRVSGRGGREPEASDRVLAARLAADSVLVHAVMMPLTFLLADSVLRHGPAGYGAQIFLWLIGVCLVLPAVLGGCGVWLARRPPGTRAARFAGLLGFAPFNRFVYAWSAMFAELPKDRDTAALALVVLRDGRRVRGGFGEWARASEDPARHDLYLDEVFDFDPVPPHYKFSGGIWLNGDDIVSVEFFLPHERPTENPMDEQHESADPLEPDGSAEPEQQEQEQEVRPPFRARVGYGRLARQSAQDPAPAPDPAASRAAAGEIPAQQPTGERAESGR